MNFYKNLLQNIYLRNIYKSFKCPVIASICFSGPAIEKINKIIIILILYKRNIQISKNTLKCQKTVGRSYTILKHLY